jgi:hypothetical protein
MDRGELLALAERCEAATGPDRELDGDIFCALGHAPFIEGAYCAYRSPAYTASLDAAMTLVPEGWRWMAGHREFSHARGYVENGGPAFVGVGTRRNPNRLWFETTAATPALALTAAALRARAALAKETPDDV